MRQKIKALHADKLYAAECKRFFIHINIYMHQQTNTKIEKKTLHISINAYICRICISVPPMGLTVRTINLRLRTVSIWECPAPDCLIVIYDIENAVGSASNNILASFDNLENVQIFLVS